MVDVSARKMPEREVVIEATRRRLRGLIDVAGLSQPDPAKCCPRTMLAYEIGRMEQRQSICDPAPLLDLIAKSTHQELLELW